MFDKLRPLGDKILVKRDETKEKTEAGIFLSDLSKEKQQTGTVIAVGNGKRDMQGILHPISVAKGDCIYFGKYSGLDLGEDYLILKEDEIVAVINPE